MVSLSSTLTLALAFLMILSQGALSVHSWWGWQARLDDTTCRHEEVTYSYTTGVARCILCGEITEQDI